MIKFFDFHFLHFLTHLAKFEVRSHFILIFISENLRAPLINLGSWLGCESGESARQRLKNTSRVEIIIRNQKY